MSDSITVYIRDCTVPLFVGVYDHEKPKPQPVVISVEARAALTRRYDDVTSADLSSIIDYDRLHDYITTALPGFGHVPLLESLGEKIINFCFKDLRIDEVTVSLHKPEISSDASTTGITMHRTRRRT